MVCLDINNNKIFLQIRIKFEIQNLSYLVYILYFICCSIESLQYQNFFYIDRAILAFPFFAVGTMLRGNIKEKTDSCLMKRGGYIMIALIMIGLVFIVNHYFNVERFDMFHFKIGKSAIVYYVSSMLGTFCVLMISRQLPMLRYISDISIGTFLILGLHLKILQYVWYLHVQEDPTRLLALGIVLAICLPLIKICEKKKPLFLGKSPNKI